MDYNSRLRGVFGASRHISNKTFLRKRTQYIGCDDKLISIGYGYPVYAWSYIIILSPTFAALIFSYKYGHNLLKKKLYFVQKVQKKKTQIRLNSQYLNFKEEIESLVKYNTSAVSVQ